MISKSSHRKVIENLNSEEYAISNVIVSRVSASIIPSNLLRKELMGAVDQAHGPYQLLSTHYH